MGKKSGKRAQKELSPELIRLLREIARVLTFLRKAAGYGSAKTFSEVQDINRSQYSRYEAGNVDMKISSLVSTLALFGVSEKDIFNPAFLAIGEDKNSVDELSNKYREKLRSQVRDQVNERTTFLLTDQVIDRTVLVLTYCIDPRTRQEILKHIGLTNTSSNFKRNAGLAMEQGWVAMTIPDKPNSRNQQYITTPAGRKALGAESKTK